MIDWQNLKDDLYAHQNFLRVRVMVTLGACAWTAFFVSVVVLSSKPWPPQGDVLPIIMTMSCFIGILALPLSQGPVQTYHRYRLTLVADDGFDPYEEVLKKTLLTGEAKSTDFTWLSHIRKQVSHQDVKRDRSVHTFGFTRLEDYVLCKLKFSDHILRYG